MAYIYLRDNTNMNMDIVNIISSYTGTQVEWVKFWNEIVISRIMGGMWLTNPTVYQQLSWVYECESYLLYMFDNKLFTIHLCKDNMLEELVQTRALIN
jgi:hypothetical protein